MCTLVHLKKYSFVFVEKYIKFSTSNRSYEKECFNCNVYFESNEATQVTYVQPSQDLSYILTLIPSTVTVAPCGHPHSRCRHHTRDIKPYTLVMERGTYKLMGQSRIV